SARPRHWSRAEPCSSRLPPCSTSMTSMPPSGGPNAAGRSSSKWPDNHPLPAHHPVAVAAQCAAHRARRLRDPRLVPDPLLGCPGGARGIPGWVSHQVDRVANRPQAVDRSKSHMLRSYYPNLLHRQGDGMTTSATIPNSDIVFRRDRDGHSALVFVHGFLDDQHVWEQVLAGLSAP